MLWKAPTNGFSRIKRELKVLYRYMLHKTPFLKHIPSWKKGPIEARDMEQYLIQPARKIRFLQEANQPEMPQVPWKVQPALGKRHGTISLTAKATTLIVTESKTCSNNLLKAFPYPGSKETGPQNNKKSIGWEYLCILIFCNLFINWSKQLPKSQKGNISTLFRWHHALPPKVNASLYIKNSQKFQSRL